MPYTDPWGGMKQGTQVMGQMAGRHQQQKIQKREQVRTGAKMLHGMLKDVTDVQGWNKVGNIIGGMGYELPVEWKNVKSQKDVVSAKKEIMSILGGLGGVEQDTSFADKSALQTQRDVAAMERKQVEIEGRKEAATITKKAVTAAEKLETEAKEKATKLKDISGRFDKVSGKLSNLTSGVDIMSEAMDSQRLSEVAKLKKEREALADQYEIAGGDRKDLGVKDRKVVAGKTYIKQDDGLWYPED